MLKSVPLVPKNPNGPLCVLIIGRVSTPVQPGSDFDACFEGAENFLQKNYQGSIGVKYLRDHGCGLDERDSILEAAKEIAIGKWNLVLMADISRLSRDARRQHAFIQDAIASGTRVIALADGLDTANEH